MKNTRLCILTGVLSTLISANVLADSHSHGGERDNHRPYNYQPEGGYKATTNDIFIDASVDKIIGSNEKISNIFEQASQGKTLVQRLSKNSYWVFTENYSTTFYVGKKSVLLLDPLHGEKSSSVLKAIKSVTDKPIKAVVYSHSHADHIAGIDVFVENAKINGIDLDIIATDKTAEKLAFVKSSLPTPTKILSYRKDSLKFDSVTLSVQGFKHAAHTGDSAMWFLKEEKVLHLPDYVNPDQMPFLGFAVAESYAYLRSNVESMLNADWTVFSSGHGNIGNKKDIKFMLSYMDDVETAVKETAKQVDWGKLIAAQPNNHQALAHSSAIEHKQLATDLLRPKYGEYYGFEASAPHQASMVASYLYLHR